VLVDAGILSIVVEDFNLDVGTYVEHSRVYRRDGESFGRETLCKQGCAAFLVGLSYLRWARIVEINVFGKSVFMEESEV
jgi:hypothetical protein